MSRVNYLMHLLACLKLMRACCSLLNGTARAPRRPPGGSREHRKSCNKGLVVIKEVFFQCQPKCLRLQRFFSSPHSSCREPYGVNILAGFLIWVRSTENLQVLLVSVDTILKLLTSLDHQWIFSLVIQIVGHPAEGFQLQVFIYLTIVLFICMLLYTKEL